MIVNITSFNNTFITIIFNYIKNHRTGFLYLAQWYYYNNVND
jgi:hypothetical protein